MRTAAISASLSFQPNDGTRARRLAVETVRAPSSATRMRLVGSAWCLLWLARDYRSARVKGGDGMLRDVTIEEGVWNRACGGECLRF